MEHELRSITIRATSGGLTLREAVRAAERYIILEALKANNDDKERVAKLLQISMSSLYRKLEEEAPVFVVGKLGTEMENE